MEKATKLWEQKIDYAGNGYFAVAAVLSLVSAIIMLVAVAKDSNSAGIAAVALCIAVVFVVMGLGIRVRRAKADAETQRAILRELSRQRSDDVEIIERLRVISAALEDSGIRERE